jgi:multiple sugar transport system permease protein
MTEAATGAPPKPAPGQRDPHESAAHIEAVPERQGVIQWASLPQRILSIYTPIIMFVVVLLFPFYWMTITTLKSNEELYNYQEYNPFWVSSPTLENINKLLFETDYPQWLTITMTVAVVATIVSVFASVLAAYAIQRLRFKGSQWVGLSIYLAYLVPPSILFIPLATMVFNLGLYDSPVALILTYPTFLIPFCTWLLIGYFKSIPFELEECALIDGATRLQILWKITLPLAIPGLISAGIFAFTLSWNEFIYALAFIQSVEKKTVPVAVLTQLVEGDVYHWGSLMAGALLGSIPVALFYSFFVEHYVSSMTGAVKE